MARRPEVIAHDPGAAPHSRPLPHTPARRSALVPTMGALHAGHLALVRLARRKADRVVVSIFVNPAQFAPHEDFSAYPRNLETDLAALTELKIDLVWAPTVQEMYPEGFATRIVPEGPALVGLEDAFRPHFFGGVATVVAKLLAQVLPDIAVFGEKDYQQLKVITRMARDLDLPRQIVGAPDRARERRPRPVFAQRVSERGRTCPCADAPSRARRLRRKVRRGRADRNGPGRRPPRPSSAPASWSTTWKRATPRRSRRSPR